MIVVLGLLAIAFSTQLLPLTVDILYLKKGSRQGAIPGLVIGIENIFLLSPFFPMLISMKSMIDIGAWGLCTNVLVFVVVSYCIRSDAPPEQKKST